jgi:probable HAF family extracellular repeat protein
MDTNSSSPNIFGDLVPSLVPDLGVLRSSNSLESGPRDRSTSGPAAPLIFGSGNDVIDFRAASNASGRRPISVFAGEGNNFVLGGRGNDRIFAGAGNDVIEAGNGNNSIVAGDGTNIIVSGTGNDTVVGGAGNDFIDAGDGRNNIVAGGGDNRILTGSGRDTIFAGAGNDVIFSGAGNDTIDAGNGRNLINAGTGNDTVTLGSDRDRVILEGGAGSVTINGFNATVDRLRLGESLLGRSLSFTTSGANTLVRSGLDLLATLVGVASGSQALVDRGPLTRYTATDLGSLAQDPATAVAVASVNAASVNDFGVVAGRFNTGAVFSNQNAAGVVNPNNVVRQSFVFENGVQTALTSTGIKRGSSDFGAADGATVTLLTPNVNTINNRGVILGTGDEVRQPVSRATDRALVYERDASGTYQLTINDFGGVESYNLDTNNSNQRASRNIVSRNDAAGVARTFERPLFIDTDGAVTSLADLGGNGGTAQSINGQGTIVGFLDTDGVLNGSETFTAAVWRVDATTGQYVLENLGTFGDEQARALDINNAGSIIGASSSGTGATATSSPFLLRDGAYTSIGSLGGLTGSANEINEFGTVVGASQIAAGTNRAYVWSLGVQTDLNSLVTNALAVNGAAVTLTNALSVNNFGDIVATGTYTYRNAANVETVGTRSYLLREVA